MKPDDFFGLWNSLPEQDKNCLSDQDLAACAKEPESGWPAHVRSCEQCGKIIRLLVDGESPRRLHEFLSMARENALKAAPERPASVLTYLRAFVAGMQPRWIALTSVALILMLGFFFWSYKREAAGTYDRNVSVSFNKDNYPQTVEFLQRSLEEIRNAPMTSEQRRTRINEINKKLSELNEQKLDQEQYAKVTDLLTQYHNELILQASTQANSKAPGDNTKLPEIILNDESKMVAKLYVTIDRVISNKNNDPKVASPSSEIETAGAVRSASQQFDIKSISPETKEIIVEDRIPERSAEQRRSIEQGLIEFSNNEKLNVRIVSAGYTGGPSSVSFKSQ